MSEIDRFAPTSDSSKWPLNDNDGKTSEHASPENGPRILSKMEAEAGIMPGVDTNDNIMPHVDDWITITNKSVLDKMEQFFGTKPPYVIARTTLEGAYIVSRKDYAKGMYIPIDEENDEVSTFKFNYVDFKDMKIFPKPTAV